MSSLLESLDVFTTDITKGLEDIGGGILTGLSDLADQLTTISDSLGELGIMQLLSWMRDDIRTGFDNVYIVLQNTCAELTALSDNLGTTIYNQLHEMFIPEKPIEAIQSLEDKLRDKIPIIHELNYSVQLLLLRMKNVDATAPNWDINLTDYHGFTGSVSVIDLSWYEPHRETIKDIITAFIWIFAIIRWIKFIPRLLGGVSYAD